MSKSEKRLRTALLLGIRCTPEEKQQLQEKAKVSGLSVGEYLRRCGLGRNIVPKMDVQMINQLSSLGGLQKHLFTQMEQLKMMTPALSQQYAEVLMAIKKSIIAVGRDGAE